MLGGVVGAGYIKENVKAKDITLDCTGSYVGGVIGYLISGKGTSMKDIIAENIDVYTTGGSFVAGIAGDNRTSITNAYLYGINISAPNATQYVSAISGYGGAVYSSAVEGYTDQNKNWNQVIAEKAQRVGGIAGYSWGTIDKTYAKNLVIKGKIDVGGIQGWRVTGTIKNSYSQDCEITGQENVGGILGSITQYAGSPTFKVYILNNYTNSNIHGIGTTNDNIGGILGYLENDQMNNQSYVFRIYNNLVANSTIDSTATNQNVGGLIGKTKVDLYYIGGDSPTYYYYNNLVVSNLSADSPIGNFKEFNHTSGLNNSHFYQTTEITNANVNMLKLDAFYKNTLKWGNNYKYTSLSENKYPLLTSNIDVTKTFLDGTEHHFKQTGIDLPEPITINPEGQIAKFSLRNYIKVALPKYDVYASDVNKINIEFNEIKKDSYFRYESNNIASENIPIEKLVYTFEYDFINPIKLIIGNTDGEEETIFESSNIAKRLSLIDGKYYYLENNVLKEKTNTLEGEFVNLYNKKALTKDGYIYDLETNRKTNKKTDALKLLDESTPIVEYTYSGNIIETYYNMSKVISSEEESITNYQTFIKNGKLFALDGNLDIYADSAIIDAYNNKEYQTALGIDGIIYDLKEKINYPEDFENENIIQMTNNFNNENHEVLIMYDNGRVYAFNYITGNVLFDTDTENEESLLSTVGNMVRSMFSMRRTALYSPEIEEYEEAIELQETLTDLPIEQVESKLEEKENENNTTVNTTDAISSQNNITNVSSDNSSKENTNILNNITNIDETSNGKPNIDKENTNSNSITNDTSSDTKNNEGNSYVTVYDSDTNKYLVYKTSSILGQDSKTMETATLKPVSETEKIESNPELKEYYETAKGKPENRNTNGIFFIIITISAIGIILVIMYRKKNYA